MILPTLQEFGIHPPVFIRKLDRLSDWNPEVPDPDRPQRVAELVFRDSDRIFSLFKVTCDRDFHSTVTAINANRTPQNQNFDFIWIAPKELEMAGIQPEKVPEGKCLQARNLHFNANISIDQAMNLCSGLIDASRQGHRCPKTKAKAILEQQKKLGCLALDCDSKDCDCESW